MPIVAIVAVTAVLWTSNYLLGYAMHKFLVRPYLDKKYPKQ